MSGHNWSADTRRERDEAAERARLRRAGEKARRGAQPMVFEPRPDRTSAIVCIPGEPVRIVKREDR